MGRYETHLENITVAYEKFADLYEGYKYFIDTSDGNTIDFKMYNFNLPHLLGVCKWYYEDNKKQYRGNIINFLIDLIANKDTFRDKINHGILLWSILFSKNSEEKTKAFNELQDFTAENLKLVVKCFTPIPIKTGGQIFCDYALFISDDDALDKGILLLTKQNNKQFIPISLLKIESKDELRTILEGQEVLLPICIEKVKSYTEETTNLSKPDSEKQRTTAGILKKECSADIIDKRVCLNEFGGGNEYTFVPSKYLRLLRIQQALIEELTERIDIQDDQIGELLDELYNSKSKSQKGWLRRLTHK